MKYDLSPLLAAEWKVESQLLRIVRLLTVHLLIDGLTVIGGLMAHQWRDSLGCTIIRYRRAQLSNRSR